MSEGGELIYEDWARSSNECICVQCMPVATHMYKLVVTSSWKRTFQFETHVEGNHRSKIAKMGEQCKTESA